MIEINVYKTDGPESIISPLNVKREWMNYNKDSYNCFPLTLSNKLGWGISFPKDISFVWNDSNNESGIQIIKGEEYCFFDRGPGVICFPTDICFKTSEDISILTIPVPNQFIDGAYCLTSLMSYSFYTAGYQVVWKITTKNKVITIPAGTPVASILPISLSTINNSTIYINSSEIKNKIHDQEYMQKAHEYSIINNRFAGWYRNATDQNNFSIGKHEVSSLNFNVIKND